MSSTENIIDVSEATFQTDVIEQSNKIPVVVDFWAPWCAPCRMLSPILEKYANDPDYNFILAKVNVDENPQLSIEFNVQGIPAVIAFIDEQVVSEFTGALPDPRVRSFLEDLIPSEIEEALDAAHSLLATHHWADAEDALREVLADYPEHPSTILNLGRALLAQGKGCEAIGYLQDCTDGNEHLLAGKLMPLATYLCQAATEWQEAEDIPPIEALYRRAAHLFDQGNVAAAMDGLLDVLRQDKRYKKAKEIVLATFTLLGDEDTLTQSYRRELAVILF
ncbi:MAG: tetratricopeptide repeat protein [Chloroflexi bacterium]|nr:tetratricopeptide repeat protein [Chloroflexota bacterium]